MLTRRWTSSNCFRRGLREGEDDLAHVGCAAELAQDGIHRRLFKFGIERRQHKSDGLLAREIVQLALDHAEIALPQAMQGGDNSSLVEICHADPPLRTIPVRSNRNAANTATRQTQKRS